VYIQHESKTAYTLSQILYTTWSKDYIHRESKIAYTICHHCF